MKTDHLYDVVIVGAGPVGLATALGLKERGIHNIRIIDKTRAFRKVGQLISVLPNGLRALKALSLRGYDAFVSSHVHPTGPPSSKASSTASSPSRAKSIPPSIPPSIPTWVYRDLSGKAINTINLSNEYWLKEYGEGRVSSSWYGLQTLLRESLPPEWIQVNCGCVGFCEDPSTGVVHIEGRSNNTVRENPYAHWTTAPQATPTVAQSSQGESVQEPESSVVSEITLSARMVVAADGINSTMRQLLYQGSNHASRAKPDYSGFSAILCRAISTVPDTLEAELNNSFFHGESLVTVCGEEVCPEPIVEAAPRIMMFRRADKWGFIIHAAVPTEQLQDKSGQGLIHEATQIIAQAHFPTSIQQFVALALPEAIQQRPYYIHRANSDTPWNTGRVVLVGDAAHGMPPFMAQGVNQGFEDAATIVPLIADLIQQNALDDSSAITRAFQQYEHQRRPQAILAQAATLAKTTLWSEQERKDYNQAIYCTYSY